MEFDIADFLPKYPDVNHSLNPVLDPYPRDTTFYQNIYNKKEFNELKLDRVEKRPLPGQAYNHQKAIARFLSSFTMYNALILDHEMGTGKSCSAFSAIENIKNTSNVFKGALVLTRGPKVLNNLIKELVYVCTSGQYIPSEYDKRLTENERSRRLKKLTSDYYTFETFEKFSKELNVLSDTSIAKRFSNLVIMIDEVHNLRVREEASSYNQIHRLLHTAKNCKILLMSGTPMKDDPSEIAAILNLVLPLDKQLPTGNDFKIEYLDKSGDGLATRYSIKKDKIPKLKQIMKGYISYLKAMSSDVKITYEGAIVKPLKHFKVFRSVMSAKQTESYDKAYRSDVKDKNPDIVNVQEETGSTSGIYSNSRQASLFVFPDGTFGKEGFDKYFTKIEKGSIFHYNPNTDFKVAFIGSTPEEKLEKIRKHSSTYASIIETVLSNPEKLHFIYDSFVHGSGSVVLGALFRAMGFGVANGNETAKAPRYAILTNSTASQQTVNNIIKKFNSPENMHGDYIKVIIGSKILAEGITLKNVQSIHVATPHWNYSELAQAIARGIRLESHKDLIDAGKTPEVKVYHHVSMPKSKTPSIDLEMYTLCESKDISIKAVERLMKESAVDCALFYERNRAGINPIDGSRECDYQSCEYTCDGISNMNVVEGNLDYSTYNLYYKTKTKVYEDILGLFRANSIIHFQEILARLQGRYTKFDIVSELKYIITSNIVVRNNLDIPCYLRERLDVYFLVDSISAGDDFLSSVYARKPIISNYSDFEVAIAETYLESIKQGANVTYCFDRLPIRYKQQFIESVIDLRDQGLTSPVFATLYEYLLSTEVISADFSTYTLENSIFKMNEEGVWVVVKETDGKKVKKPAEKKLKDEKYSNAIKEAIGDHVLVDFENADITEDDKYVGLYNSSAEHSFCILDTKPKKKERGGKAKTTGDDIRTKTTGRACKSIHKPELAEIINYLKLDYEDKEYENIDQKVSETVDGIKATVELTSQLTTLEDKKRFLHYFSSKVTSKDICVRILKKLLENGKVFASKTCGEAGAKKKE